MLFEGSLGQKRAKRMHDAINKMARNAIQGKGDIKSLKNKANVLGKVMTKSDRKRAFKKIQDWQINLGIILLEGSLGINKVLRFNKSVSNKPTEIKKKAADKVDKWWKKKKLRTSTDKYKKNILGEQ